MKKLSVVLAFLFLSSNLFSQTQRTIEVFGNAEIKVVPDKMSLSIYLREEGNNVQSLKRSIDISTSEVISILKDANIAENNIQTSGISVYSNYIPPENPESVSKFTASNDINFILLNMDKYEDLMDRLIQVKNIFVNAPVFQYSKEAETRSRAREDALIAAKVKAESMASALGIKIGRVMNISEQSSDIYYPQPFNVSTEMRQSGMNESQTFMKGQIVISVSVKVVFELTD